MKKLSKIKRHNIYVQMLTLFNERVERYSIQDRIECDGLCYTLSILFDRGIIKTNITIDALPEIMAYRPVVGTGFWFNPFIQKGIDKRISILQACIEQTKINE